MTAITTCRNWTAMHRSAPVAPPPRSKAIRCSLLEMPCNTPVCQSTPPPITSRATRHTGRSHLRILENRGRQRPFVLEQPALAVEAPAEPRERAVRPDDAMAGHDDGDRVLPIGGADGAGGPQVAQAARQLAVAQRRPVRD